MKKINRRNLLIGAGALATLGVAQQIVGFNMMDKLMSNKNTERMPLLFIGHGSPMNAISTNAYTQFLQGLNKKIPTPQAILVVSAHWLTDGTWVTEMPKPKTIHDFYGFPQELFNVQYPAPGSPETAKLVQAAVTSSNIYTDSSEWGLDHGTWAVLRHIYPDANIPVLQLSINIRQSPEYHIQIAQELSKLRDKGVLILGSGNLVHNLRTIKWEPNAQPFDWAVEFDEWLKKTMLDKNYKSVLYDYHKTQAGQLSVPSMDHYYPLHYILGAASESDELKFEYEEMQNGSISMRSVSLGMV